MEFSILLALCTFAFISTVTPGPNNMMLLVGHDDLIADSTERIDDVIDGAGLREKLRSSAIRARKTRSGDTDKKKEFQDGFLIIAAEKSKIDFANVGFPNFIGFVMSTEKFNFLKTSA